MIHENHERERDTILWLTGWSMPNSIFDRLHAALPEFQHMCANYTNAASPEEMFARTEAACFTSTSNGCGRVLIAGWSLGGLLAMRLAAKGLAHGIVLFSTNARFTRPRVQRSLGWSDSYVRQMISTLIRRDRQTVETKFRELLFSAAGRNDGLPEAVSLSGGWTTEALVAGLQVLRQADFITLLPEMDYPIMLIHGTEDRVCPYAAAEEMLLHMPRAKLTTVEGGGHVPFLGREGALAQAIRRWWDEQKDPSYSTSI